MENQELPPPTLHGEDAPQSSPARRRWLLFSLWSLGVWVVAWGIMITGIQTGVLDKPPVWIILIILSVVLLSGLAAFPAFLAGLLHFQSRQGKTIAFVSGLHAATVVFLLIAVATNWNSK